MRWDRAEAALVPFRGALGVVVAACFFLSLSLAGCAHTEPSKGKTPIDGRAAARSIELCRTTEAELRARLGEPTREGILHGSRVLSWITQWDSPTRYLAVMLDDRGVVVDLYWDVPTEIPWVPASQCAGR
jgi:hypothetical protein